MITLENGDSTLLQQELKDNSIDLILTDPPYGVGFENDFYDDSIDYVKQNIGQWFTDWHRALKEDSYLVLYVGTKTLNLWLTEADKAGFTFKNIVATRSFNNGSIAPKNNFGFQFQPIIVLSKGKGKSFNEVDFIPTSDAWFNDKRNKNPKPFTYQYPNFIGTDLAYATAKRASKNLHPNEKNVDLLKFFVELLTDEGQTVLEPFGGSGSTLVACKETNRKAIGFEQDTNYYNTIKERLK